MARSSEKNYGSGADYPIILHEKGGPDRHAESRSYYDLQINCFGSILDFAISAADSTARISDLVPMAQKLCDKIVGSAIENTDRRGDKVTCERGCKHCCSYMVSLSSAEAFKIRDEILAMPTKEQRQSIRKMMTASRHILNKSLPVNTDTIDDSSSEHIQSQNLSHWYGSLDLACPFLENNSCSIYSMRPLVCREHLAVSEAFTCKFSSPGMPRTVNLPVNISEVLMKTVNKLENTDDEAIIFPLVMLWSEAEVDRSQRLWPAKVLVETFIETLTANSPSNTCRLQATGHTG